ncbi:site-specific DNA-methyltransferase [Glutamicibacter sp.]|uniref:site-specific DNA-methyltransferase n=2 Tax=Glutamicibacter sp. TaxID=1931995 RepID=UPI002B49FC87|nr:site-specific DNA-methyltransferase [Glutamicibacter sp.]HJX78998.1 site-specific DNA-methyltransferase [Glutamicibacter sp.]
MVTASIRERPREFAWAWFDVLCVLRWGWCVMEKRYLHSPDLTARNVERIAELFPSVVVEAHDADGSVTASVDFDLLRQELSDHIVEGPQERYQLDWPGKRAATFAANAPIAKTLRPMREESVNFDTTKNLFIEGDNLDALKLLQESYLGKVKMIYIDPPYNTGGDAFVYPDDYSRTNEEYLAFSGQIGESGVRLESNSESNGRFHSDWLTMMYPRLKLARNLLTEDGVIFVSIDDNESGPLKSMLDEIFGASNFLTTVVWQKVYSPMNSATQFASVHDYIHVYARSGTRWESNLLPRTAEQDQAYKNPDNDSRGRWKAENATAAAGHATPSQFYALTTPAGNVFTPPPGRAWLYTEPRYQEMVRDNRVWFGESGQGRPAIKRFMSEVKQGRVAQTLWPYTEVGHNQDAKKELLARINFGASDVVFSTPKPTKLIRRMLHLATNPQSEDIVLDFFAGSGTTADAVIQQNLHDGGNRRFILVQLDEPMGAPEGSFPTISSLAMERVRRAGQISTDGVMTAEAFDVGFRALRVDTSSKIDVLRPAETSTQGLLALLETSIKADRTGEDLLLQVLLDWGLEPTVPIASEDIDGCEVFAVDDDALLACFAETVTPAVVMALAVREPLRVVFRDDAFESDAARINAEQIFKEISPSTEVRTI